MAGKSTTGSRFYFRALLSPPACLSVPTNLNPHTDRPSQTPLSAEGRGFRHLPALHAHFSFLLSSWEKPRNERNTEGWTGRGWAEPGYWRVLLHVCSTKRTARRKAKTPVRCRSVSGLHRSAGESSQAIGIFNFGKMREGKRARQREREKERWEGGRQSQESGSSYSNNTKSERQQTEASVR